METLRLPGASSTTFDSLTVDSVDDILVAWASFCSTVDALLGDSGDLSVELELISSVQCLCQYGLQSRLQNHFLRSLEVTFERKGASKFWRQLESYDKQSVLTLEDDDDGLELVLCKALEDITLEKHYHEKCVLMVVHAIQSYEGPLPSRECNSVATSAYLLSKYQLIVSSVLMSLHPGHFPEILHWYFKKRLEELSLIMEDASEYEVCHDRDHMDIDESCHQRKFSSKSELVHKIGRVVLQLKNLGFISMTEDAYASAIFLLLKAKVHALAGDDYRSSVLEPIKGWIEAVPLQFLRSLLAYLGESVDIDNCTSSLKSPLDSCPSSLYPGNDDPSESLIRWKLRLEYFAYESLQDLRITKLFEIIVDYPDSSPAIEDLKQCLDYTGQHSKLVDLFISALKYRLLTASASTNDILHQYVSTIKALRTIDPAGVFLEAVSEPIREYLRGRKDTIKCIVTMLTDGSGENTSLGNAGDSLLEELNRDEENQEGTGLDDDFFPDDKQAWINCQSWEPDPIEADPLKHSRHGRKVDILGMIVGIIGSKDQLVSEYRVMLAEKLLNKSDYDIDSEIRTLELLKIHFGESSMQKCEIMLNDLIDSKRVNSNIKATISKQPHTGAELREQGLSLDILSSTIISTNFWPPIQEENYNLPTQVDQLLTDYAKRFHELKIPRKLQWKKNLGLVKLELQFEEKEVQFTVAPMHAAIIMQFQDQPSWTSSNLAAAMGVSLDTLNRRINFWISKGILKDSTGENSDDCIFTLVDGNVDGRKNNLQDGSNEDFLCGDDDSERSCASVDDQLRQEMTVYEKFIMGMLTNFGSMSLDKIHNTLKMFCIAEPKYDKSLHQLQSFLSDLIAQERLEHRDGLFYLKK